MPSIGRPSFVFHDTGGHFTSCWYLVFATLVHFMSEPIKILASVMYAVHAEYWQIHRFMFLDTALRPVTD